MFLGDQAKPGFGWLALVGFVGAVVGAVLVAWYGSGDPDHFGEAPPMKGGWRRGREDDDSTDTDLADDQSESGATADEIDSFGFAPADFDDDDDDDEVGGDEVGGAHGDGTSQRDTSPRGGSPRDSDDNGTSKNTTGAKAANTDSTLDGPARSDIDFTEIGVDDRRHSQRYSS